MLKLTADDQAWLKAYRKALDEHFPGLVDCITIYGSKARGTATPDSDLDVLVMIREGDWRLKRALTLPAYDLAISTDVVPSIQVYTRAEWEKMREHQSVFREAIERDGVPVR